MILGSSFCCPAVAIPPATCRLARPTPSPPPSPCGSSVSRHVAGRLCLSVSLLNPGFSVLDDGERYTSSCLAPNGATLVCNSKGCRPLQESEKVRLLERQFPRDQSGLAAGSRTSNHPLEAYYRNLLSMYPANPLVLSNYARFLSQVKADYRGAEEYYERAILAGQEDGETLAQYATVIWDNYGDGARSCSYFKQALQASPDNSYVLAAYVSFMWDVGDNHKT